MEIHIAGAQHLHFAKTISQTIDDSARDRGTGIARRTPEYIMQKMENGNAVVAFEEDEFAGFCYIEVWGHGKYVAHSGLIVAPKFRGRGLAVHFSELTDDPEFWKGCQTCKNFDVLTRTERKLCLCTGMLYDPEAKEKQPKKNFLNGLFKSKK